MWSEGESDADANLSTVDVAVTVVVAAVVVAVIVTVVSFVILGNVEPDVRLKITSPASMENGAVLPLVAVLHVLLDGLPWLQQNRVGLKSIRNAIAPPLRLTAISMLASRPSHNQNSYGLFAIVASRHNYHLRNTESTPGFAMFGRCSCL